MKKLQLLAAMVFCGLFVQAQTIEVSGLQSGVWEADTVLVTGNVTVQDALDILPGTTVLFQTFCGITVEKGASLKAVGTETDSILFTVADTTGFHLFNAGRGGWNGFHFHKAGAVRFGYCRLQYGKAALDEDQDGGAINIIDCDDVSIENSVLFCNFSREHGGGLNAVNSKVVMNECDVNNNLTYTKLDTVYFMYGGGLRFLKCDVKLNDVWFRNNIGQNAIGGALSLDSCAVHIDRCRFEHNYGINGGGLYLIRSNDWECSITNSLFANNISGHFGGGLAISDSSPIVDNITVVGNLSIGVNCGGIFFYQLSSPIMRNCIIYGNFNDIPIEEPVQMWTWTYDGNAPQFHNCLIQFGLENISNNENVTVFENCIDENPRFVDPENGNYRLCDISPCRNAGLTVADDFGRLDLAGNPRVWDDVIDMGAYEYSTIGVGEMAQNISQMHIVGNPITVSSYAEIELDHEGLMYAKLYSMEGKLLVGKSLGHVQKGSNRVALGEMFASLRSGTYVLVLQVADKVFVAKSVK